MSDEFIREVDDDLKQEKTEKLWKKLLPYIVSLSLGIVLSTTRYVAWDNFSKNSRQQYLEEYEKEYISRLEQDQEFEFL